MTKRVFVGVYSNGFALAGNFAYMSLLAVFSFFMVAAAIAGIFGQSEAGIEIINNVFQTLPPRVAETLHDPIVGAMQARSGPLLWLSGLTGLWTTGSLIETIRDILHKAYGTVAARPFWQYRLRSIAVIVGAVFLLMVSLSAQVLITAAAQIIQSFFPWAQDVLNLVTIGRVIPFVVLFGALYILFQSITPRRYRDRKYPKWPGAVLVSLWWVGAVTLLPYFVRNMANYDLTYGSLAGVMITLIFFYFIGLGMVTGATLNAALANDEPDTLEEANGSNGAI